MQWSSSAKLRLSVGLVVGGLCGVAWLIIPPPPRTSASLTEQALQGSRNSLLSADRPSFANRYASTEELRWDFELGPFSELPLQWIATEAREHKVESGQIEIQSAGNVSRIVGAKFQATPGKHLIFMAPDVRAQVLQQAQLVDGKGFVPSRSMILEILPSGELEYRYVLGHFDGAEAHRAGTLGESTPDERGFLHCEWYAAIAESDRRPPTTIAPVDRVGLCAFVTQTSGVDAVIKLEARGENRKPTRIVGSFEASGALRLWAQP